MTKAAEITVTLPDGFTLHDGVGEKDGLPEIHIHHGGQFIARMFWFNGGPLGFAYDGKRILGGAHRHAWQETVDDLIQAYQPSKTAKRLLDRLNTASESYFATLELPEFKHHWRNTGSARIGSADYITIELLNGTILSWCGRAPWIHETYEAHNAKVEAAMKAAKA
jgi:hypothetical protein